MKICTECEKKFGFLEKIYYTENGEMYCASCVSRLRKEKEKGDGKFVELKETESGPEPSNDYFVKIPSEGTQPQNTVSSSGRWEFRVVKLTSDPMQKTSVTIEKFEDVINKMGDDGWELVSVIPLNILLMKSSAREEPAMIFKRKK